MSERSGWPVEVLTAGGEGNGYVQNPFVFKGGTQGRATGWVQFGNRFYDPSVGRWTQQSCERQAWVRFAAAVHWHASMVNPLAFVAASVNFFSVLMIESKGSAHFRCTA